MPPSLWTAIGACNGFLAVAAGAFGAHALKSRLSPEQISVFETAARYQMFHGLGLLAAGILCRGPWLTWVATAFSLGIILFSGSLYALSLSGIRLLGVITPLGGVSFLVGWGLLAWSQFKS